ncbi:heparinase II/III family protein [Streptomyces sp. NBC_00654]|uniref:heparinase II/III domain-containing protein n=1 Tax=Streptomyces sp. NBC_00654 TaxID=2975799 RepID=UPI00225C1688|nr:heparinase II/III family protein [Streptomyces sp. NBC_00654]MCX4967676.1 heparinase II/III family protein [Streptomyces sp. NBC_00654]
MAALRRIARERGGWWHAYICPAHGVELEHGDLLAGVFPAGGARCAHGCRVDNEAVRGAWTVLSHQAWARHLRVLAHRGGQDSEAVARLVEYAALYAELAVDRHGEAQTWMLRGRLFHQALTDAIWAVNVGDTVSTLAERGVQGLAVLLPLLDDLEQAALDAREVLTGQGHLASNYTAWLNSAGAAASRAAAAVRGREWDGAEEWLEGEGGLYAHLRAAVAEDGWEWEGSTYYHGFVLRAALLALRSTDPSAIPADVVGVLAGMTDVLATVATPGGILPALHDGPYLRAPLALEWLELVALAQQLVPSAALEPVAARAREELGAADDGLDALLDGWFAGPPLPERPAPATPVTVYPVAGYGVLRAAGIHALVDFGPHGGSHGHRDKLSLYLYGDTTPWQPDPGQVPYAHTEFRDLYASTEAHPAFRVDGAEQAECAGTLLGSDAVSVTAEVTGAYEGVRAVRHVAVGACYLVDLLTVTGRQARRVTAQLRPATSLDVQVQAAGPMRTTWYGDETLHGWHTHTSGVTVRPLTRPGPGPADDPQRTRTRVDLTAESEHVVFASVYQAASAGPAVSEVRLDGEELTVELADGTTARFRTEG